LIAVLQKCHWPGNIRELENLVKRYVILGKEERITSDLVTREPEYFNPDLNFDESICLKKLLGSGARFEQLSVLFVQDSRSRLAANRSSRKRSEAVTTLWVWE
jgi:DNA-binding NtrC family response regulator